MMPTISHLLINFERDVSDIISSKFGIKPFYNSNGSNETHQTHEKQQVEEEGDWRSNNSETTTAAGSCKCHAGVLRSSFVLAMQTPLHVYEYRNAIVTHPTVGEKKRTWYDERYIHRSSACD